jgi:hypothetical protein
MRSNPPEGDAMYWFVFNVLPPVIVLVAFIVGVVLLLRSWNPKLSGNVHGTKCSCGEGTMKFSVKDSIPGMDTFLCSACGNRITRIL